MRLAGAEKPTTAVIRSLIEQHSMCWRKPWECAFLSSCTRMWIGLRLWAVKRSWSTTKAVGERDRTRRLGIEERHLEIGLSNHPYRMPVLRLPSNTAFQPTRCASLALQDRWHFDASTDLSMLYPRSERLNADRWAALTLIPLQCHTLRSSICSVYRV